MNKIFTTVVATTCGALLLACSSLAFAQQIRPVPGSSAGYLYFPATGTGGGAQVQLAIVKTGVFTNYAVTYTKAGAGSPTTLCAAAEIACSVSMPVGIVKLEVNGNFTAGLPIAGANWGGDCAVAGQSADCQVALSAGAPREVRVRADCDGAPTTLTAGGVTTPVLCAGFASNGDLLLAAHKNTGASKLNGTAKGVCGNSNSEDGRSNVTTIDGASASCKSAALDYCKSMAIAGRTWYLPAINELTKLRNPPVDISGMDFWSSTEVDRKSAYYRKGSTNASSSDKKYKYSYPQLCYTRVSW